MIFTKEGLGALKYSIFVFVAALGVAVFFIAGSYYYWQAERANDTTSQRALAEMRYRLEAAKREQEDFRTSESNYKALVARGVFAPEQRLDLLEAMLALKKHHHLVRLEYEIGPQRPVKLTSASVSGIDVLGSRIHFKATALHDGDITAFLDEFPRLRRGLFPLDRCMLKRGEQRNVATVSPPAAQSPRLAPPNAVTASAAQSAVDDMLGGVQAECSLEWLTLLDKRAPMVAPNTANGAGKNLADVPTPSSPSSAPGGLQK